MKTFLLLIAPLIFAACGCAQTSTVTATVAPYSGGTVVATFVNGGGGTPPTTTAKGTINSTGIFTLKLAENSAPAYAPSSWSFVICAQSIIQTCYTTSATVKALVQDITPAFQTAPSLSTLSGGTVNGQSTMPVMLGAGLSFTGQTLNSTGSGASLPATPGLVYGTSISTSRQATAADIATTEQSATNCNTAGYAWSPQAAACILSASNVPNPSAAAQLPIANSGGTAYVPVVVSGDASLSSGGAFVVTKTNGVAFSPSATVDATNATNINSGVLAAARVPAATGSVKGAVILDPSQSSNQLGKVASTNAFSDLTGLPVPAATLLVPQSYNLSTTFAQGQMAYDSSGYTYQSLVGGNNNNALPNVPTSIVNSYWRLIGLSPNAVTGGSCATSGGQPQFPTGLSVNGVPTGCELVPYASLSGPPTSLAADATAAANAQTTANAAIPSVQEAAANGVATLNSSSQVVQVDSLNLPLTGGSLSGSVTGPSFVPQNTTAGPNTGNSIDDFFTLSNITTTAIGAEAGGGCNEAVPVANHPGVLSVTSGTVASTGSSCNWGNSATNGNYLSSGLWLREADVEVPVLPGTTAGSYYVGAGSTINSITPPYGTEFYLSSTNGVVNDWYCRYNTTAIDSTVPAVASAWTRLTIKSDGTNMHYLINGTEVCGTGIALSNLASQQFYLMTAAAYTTSTTSLGISVDYFTQWQQVTR